MPMLDKWDSFYVIVGSAGGALIGLQFVVLTLIAERRLPDAARAGAAFSTPTIVHFSVVLGVSALFRMPWNDSSAITAICGSVGVLGIAYTVVVTRRMHAQTAYEPDLEDWSFHIGLPLLAYLVLAGSAYLGLSNMRVALFAVGGAALVLLFAGIHNAWDAISYHVLNRTLPGAPKTPEVPCPPDKNGPCQLPPVTYS